MKVCETWAVAAVYLMKEKSAHYDDITSHILGTNLTRLGEKGGTPSQTVGSVLRQKRISLDNVFYSKGNGFYSLADEDSIKDCDEVKLVFEMLEWKENVNKLKDNMTSLETSISSIRQLCDKLF